MMARSLLVLGLLLAVLSTALPTSDVNRDIVISEASRVIDIKTHVEEVVSELTIDNKGSSPISSFLVAVPSVRAPHLAYVQGMKGEKVRLATEQVSVSGQKEGDLFFKITFASPIKAGGRAEVVVIMSFTHTLRPYPAEVPQGQSQLVQYKNNVYIYSPYTVKKQSTVVNLASSTVEKYTETKADKEGDTITYGPYANVEPFSYSQLYIHSENNKPFATMTTMVKEIEISHWGNIAVEEHYVLRHTGAKLKGSFSRFDYQRTSNPASDPSFRQITAYLPSNARDIYYRDQIGNISTSHAREGDDAVTLEVEPRFPMFGGWKADFYTGYNVPADTFLSTDYATGKYVLNISFSTPFPEVDVDALEVRVILPEGANSIEWAAPFPVDSESLQTRVTYLDLTGRPVLILRKHNVIKRHAEPFQVAYHFSNISMLREPIMIVCALMAFFAVSMLYVRLEVSISDSKGKGGGASRIQDTVDELSDLYSQITALYESGDLPAAETSPSEQLVKSFRDKIEELAKSNETAAPSARKLRDVVDSFKAVAKKAFSKNAVDAKVIGKARDKFSTLRTEGEQALSELSRF